MKGVFYEKILLGNRAGGIGNCTKIKQSGNFCGGLD